MGGAEWPDLILINHRIEFPNQSKWIANIFALFIHHTQNASYNHHYHNIILNYRCDFRQILRCITTTGHKAGFRWSAVHLFTMYQFICIVVPIDCWAAAIWWLRSLSLQPDWSLLCNNRNIIIHHSPLCYNAVDEAGSSINNWNLMQNDRRLLI